MTDQHILERNRVLRKQGLRWDDICEQIASESGRTSRDVADVILRREFGMGGG